MPPDIKALFDRFLADADAVISGLPSSADPFRDAMGLLDQLESLNQSMAARKGVPLPEHGRAL